MTHSTHQWTEVGSKGKQPTSGVKIYIYIYIWKWVCVLEERLRPTTEHVRVVCSEMVIDTEESQVMEVEDRKRRLRTKPWLIITETRKGLRKPLGMRQCDIKKMLVGVPTVAQQVKNLLSMRMWVQSLALVSGLRIRPCHKLRCRSQMQLRSRVVVAVVQAGSCSYDSTPSLGTSMCCRCNPRKKKQRGKKKKMWNERPLD